MEFDAYHKWLGIPPHHQPPHHYRLLGVDLFEQDGDVIDTAANQRITYLQELATGEHSAESQKLLNEISQARRCLLNSEKKFLYDMELRKRLEAGQAKPAAATANNGPSKRLVIAGGVAGIVLLVVLGIVLRGGGNGAGTAAEAGEIVLDWPVNQREGAQVLVGGKLIELPAEPIAEVNVPVGRYALTLRRTGYADINVNLVILPGERKQLRPSWRKIPQ